MSQTTESKNKALVLEAFDTLFNKRDYMAAQRKEALDLFYTLRKDLSDAFSELEIVVVKPPCETCAGQR